MSVTIGAVIPESLFKKLENEQEEQGYLSISETIRVILRDYFKEKERIDESANQVEAAKRPQPA